jgi:hypothetical protein
LTGWDQWAGSVATLPGSVLCLNNNFVTGFQAQLSVEPLSVLKFLDRASGYMDCLIKEAIQIRLNYKNFNKDSGFTLSWAWNPVTKLLFKHNIDPGKAATEPTHRSQPVKDLLHKQTGPGINWTKCFSQP